MTISLFGHVCLAKTIDPELRHAKVGLGRLQIRLDN
jgi:hypothetical protein